MQETALEQNRGYRRWKENREREANIRFGDIAHKLSIGRPKYTLDVRPPDWKDDSSWHHYQLLRQYSRTGRGFKLDERYLIDEVIVYEKRVSKMHAEYSDLWKREPESWIGTEKWEKLCEAREILDNGCHSINDPWRDIRNDLEVDLMISHYVEIGT